MKPCVAFRHNSVWRQIGHILQEVGEVVVELVKGDYDKAAREVADIQIGCETLLYILGYRYEGDRNHLRNVADIKNAKRGYHNVS